MNRVAITEQAATIVAQIQEKNPTLIFHQSGGCCDGSSPMLLPAEDFYLDNSDVFLGEIAGIKYYMNQDQYDYWKHTYLTVDIIEGRGASFSLEIPLGLRFIIHSRLLNEEETAYFNKAT